MDRNYCGTAAAIVASVVAFAVGFAVVVALGVIAAATRRRP